MARVSRTISGRTLNVLYDIFSQYSVLREIEQLFESEFIYRDEHYTSNQSGQRRSCADTYVHSLDLTIPSDRSKLARVVQTFVIRNEQSNLLSSELWRQFNVLLNRDGWKYEDGKFVPLGFVQEPMLTNTTVQLDAEHIERDWQRALDKVESDPEGSITAIRSLLESTCRWILDELKIEYKDDGDISRYYQLVASELNLSPSAHDEQLFKQILGSAQGLVSGLAGLRNKYGDAHGKGQKYYRPSPRHAKLAIHLGGALAMFLVETYLEKHSTAPKSKQV